VLIDASWGDDVTITLSPGHSLFATLINILPFYAWLTLRSDDGLIHWTSGDGNVSDACTPGKSYFKVDKQCVT